MDRGIKKVLLIEIIYFCGILIIAYCETNGYNLNSFLNKMKDCILNNLTLFIASVTALATVVYAIISLWTLREMKKQRECTYMPDIILGEEYFRIYYKDNTKGYKESHEFSYNEKPEPINLSENKLLPSLNIYNIGLAAAKNITIEYSFPYEKLKSSIDEINSSLKDNCRKFFIELRNENNIIHIESVNNNYDCIYQFNKDAGPKFHHLLPHNNKIIQWLIIPEYINVLFFEKINNYINCYYKDEKWIFPNIDGVEIKISYSDINNKIITKKCTLSINFLNYDHKYSLFRYEIKYLD